MPRPRRFFPPEYMAEVVELIRCTGKTVGPVVRELDLTETAVPSGSAAPSTAEYCRSLSRTRIGRRHVPHWSVPSGEIDNTAWTIVPSRACCGTAMVHLQQMADLLRQRPVVYVSTWAVVLAWEARAARVCCDTQERGATGAAVCPPRSPAAGAHLWRLLYESAARANELLALDVQDLELANRRARVHSKGGAVEWVFWQTGSAQLLPRLLAGRTGGPVFLGDRQPTRAVAGLDLDPASGRARLSYRRAAELFQAYTGWTLHQLRHSALTQAAEDGTNLPLLLARSRHASVRSLERYARPGPEAVARHLAETDPARRRT